ncbi:MAG: DUF488 domain-containing protein [Candidatus Bathyarchaeia archaeon]
MLRIFTVGHSTRTFDELVKLLQAYEASILIDVRSFPRSFKNPQLNKEVIGVNLGEHNIRYVWMKKLGGRRKGLGKKSKNICWKNQSFRNYADYMETPAFLEGIDELTQLAREGTPAIMCAQAVYWRCHRSMISDYLKSKRVEVTHILDEKHIKEHEYTQCAKLVDGQLSYH